MPWSTRVLCFPSSKSAAKPSKHPWRAGVSGAPVVDAAGRFEGTVALAELTEATDQASRVGDLADAGAPAIMPDSHLDTALESITSADMSWVSVLDDDRRVVGVLSISDLVAAYRRELLASAHRVSALGAASGAFELASAERSGLAGQALRDRRASRGLTGHLHRTQRRGADAKWRRRTGGR